MLISPARFVLSGGPGAGKTSLLETLALRGYPTMPEAARGIIQQRLSQGETARPAAHEFATDILHIDMQQYDAHAHTLDTPIFYDRGVVDALYMLDRAGALTPSDRKTYLKRYSYRSPVFLLPPWEDIYCNDSERDQTYQQAVAIFDDLKSWYRLCGYRTVEVPRASLVERADFLIAAAE